jgi:hypothetical protein
MIKKSVYGGLEVFTSTLYTVPNSKKAEWVMMYVTNIGGSTASFNLYIQPEGQPYSVLYNGKTLSSKATLKMGGAVNDFIMLPAGTQIKASASSSSAIEIVISVIEHDDIIQGG